MAAETICALAFLILPNFLTAFMAFLGNGDVTFSPIVRTLLVLTGVYPLVDTYMRVYDKGNYKADGGVEVGPLRANTKLLLMMLHIPHLMMILTGVILIHLIDEH